MKETNQNRFDDWASNLHDDSVELGDNSLLDPEEILDKKVVDEIYDVRNKVAQVQNLTSQELVWENLKTRLLPKQLWRELAKYAAAIFISLLVGGSAVWVYNKHHFSLSEFTSITAPNGQISNITLFDGTNVWLNAGSTLKYKQDFNQKNREVFLEGEALFDVIKNKESRFVVNAGNSQVKVFGTTFNLKAYREESYLETVLVEGEIEFVSRGKAVKLSPGDHLLYSKITGNYSKNGVNPAEYTAWKGGKIYFNNQTLSNITSQLERWYEVKFDFNDERIKSYRFTGVINKDKTLDYALKIIAGINKVDFEIKEEQITIKDSKR